MGLMEDAVAAYEEHHAHQKAEVREERIKQRAKIAREAPQYLHDVLGLKGEITSWYNGVRQNERDGAVFDIDGVQVVYWRRQYAGNAQALYLLSPCEACNVIVPKGGPVWDLYALGQAIVEGSAWSHDCPGEQHRSASTEDRLVGALRDYVREVSGSAADGGASGGEQISRPTLTPANESSAAKAAPGSKPASASGAASPRATAPAAATA